MKMFSAALVLSSIAWLVAQAVFCVYRVNVSSWRELGILPAAPLLVSGFLSLIVPNLIFLNIVLALLLFVCAPWVSSKAFAGLSLGATIATLVIIHYQWNRDQARFLAAQPSVSIASRLRHERSTPRKQPSPSSSTAQTGRATPGDELLVLPFPAATLEEELSKQLEWREYRNERLQGLHEGIVAGFIGMPYFGEARMADLYRSLLSWRRGLSPVPQLRASPKTRSAQRERVFAPRPRDLPELDLGDLQFNTLVDFVNVPGQGYFVSRDNVIGFQPHGLISPHHPERKDRREDSWFTARIELMSLLKHDSPRVYLSEHLPAMEELRSAKTRSLDGFEEAALIRVQGGEDLVVHATTTRIRMLGSIRALKQCLECHSVESGELLGAFSYHLGRTVAAEPEPTGQSEFEPEPPEDSSDKPVL